MSTSMLSCRCLVDNVKIRKVTTVLTLSARTRLFEYLSKNAVAVLVGTLILTAILAIPFVTMQPTESASQEPSGIVFDARDRMEERFIPLVFPISIIVEASEGSITDKATLLDLKAASANLQADPDIAPTLLRTFDPTSGLDVFGLLSFADIIETSLPNGIEESSQAEIDSAVASLIENLGMESRTLALSTQTTFDSQANRWIVPATTLFVLADNEILGFPTGGVALGTDTEPEEYARSVVVALSSETNAYQAWGIAIDVNLTSAEQGEAAGPFIGFTILAILIIVAVSFRSYWVMAVTGAGLAGLIVWLYGITNLIGLKDDLILSLIVPIAMVSFGIDFAFHAVGRYREEQSHGRPSSAAFVVGMAGVIGALTLALISDAVAFLSNTASGIESIIQFGVGTAIALAAAYLLLGIATPLAISLIDDRLGSRPVGRRHTVTRVAGATGAGMFAMAVTLLLVFIAPVAGVVALFLYVGLVVLLPARLAKPGTALEASDSYAPGWVAMSLSRGTVAVTRRWRIVLPVAAVFTIGATALALQVPTEFDVKDFFAEDTAFVTGLDKLDEHIGERAGEPAVVSIEADISDPQIVAAISRFEESLQDSGAQSLANDSTGVLTDGGVVALLTDLWSSPAALSLVKHETAIEITDNNRDGVPDTTEQLTAIYSVTKRAGIPLDADHLLRTPGTVPTDIWIAEDGSTGATIISIGILDTSQQESIVQARASLDPLASALEAELRVIDENSVVVVTGGPIIRQESLDAVSRALGVSLPISVLLCLLVASAFMRSVRLGVVSVIPILITVAAVYAFMFVAGFSINIVTATIGAISIGIGIDFAIHYTMRYREELARLGNRMEAVGKTSEGTGVALLASAASSVVGFGILALSPMPLFASYGLLTAVRIAMAAFSTLVVLPSLLVVVTKDGQPDAVDPVGELIHA